ncbi:MAG: hypothetical protein D6761_04840 [Candidatus Dadabacteria bacterium]|nr:MAG: hypothetical protein D6761_04840 [Candidatus Dadabacteria bacterium]
MASGSIEFNDANLPLVVVKGHGTLAMDECKQQCGGFERLMADDARYVAIIDYRDCKLKASLAVHRYLGQWARDHRDAMHRCSPASAILIRSHLLKAVINPILKLMRLPNDVRVFNDESSARDWLRGIAAQHGLDSGPI